MISDFRKEEYFCGNDWTPNPTLNPFTNFDFWRGDIADGGALANVANPQKSQRLICLSGRLDGVRRARSPDAQLLI
jgi:hypothetical protein